MSIMIMEKPVNEYLLMSVQINVNGPAARIVGLNPGELSR